MDDLYSMPIVSSEWKAHKLFEQGAKLVKCRKQGGATLVCDNYAMAETFYKPVYVSGDNQLNLRPE